MVEDYGSNEQKQFAFDLRQRRANVIAGCIEATLISMKEENFYQWFKDIKDLYCVSEHMYHSPEIETEYERLSKEVEGLANKYQATWKKPSNNPTEMDRIDKALRVLFKFIMKQIEEAGAFGTHMYDEDEI